jgi:hypothetical protein
MSIAAFAESPAPSAAEWFTQPAQAVERFAVSRVEESLRLCRGFLDWHRENRLLRDAPPEVCKESDRAHAWLLRFVRLLHGQMLDPEFPQPALARRVEGTLWQLQEAWAQTHNPMAEAEADALIARHFPPDGSGA